MNIGLPGLLAALLLAVTQPAVAQQVDSECEFWGANAKPPCMSQAIPIPVGLEIWRSVGDPRVNAYLIQGEVADDVASVADFFRNQARRGDWRRTEYHRDAANGVLRVGYLRGALQFKLTLAPNGVNSTRMTLESSQVNQSLSQR